jgi:hypothetical protein
VQLGEPFVHLAVLFAGPRETFARFDALSTELREPSLDKRTYLTRQTSDVAVSISGACALFTDFPCSRTDWRFSVGDFDDSRMTYRNS